MPEMRLLLLALPTEAVLIQILHNKTTVQTVDFSVEIIT